MATQQVTANGLCLRYTIQGQGRPALLLHGHASASSMWERVVSDYLQNTYRCFMVDLPGHGGSAKPGVDWYSLQNFTETLFHFCLELNLADLLLVGHSLGGLLGLNLSLDHPCLVDRLILVAPAVNGRFLAYLDWLIPLEDLTRRQSIESLVRIYQNSRVLAVPAALNTYAHPRMIFSGSFKHARGAMAQCTPQSLFGSYKTIRRADLSQRLAGLQLPTLVIVGARDRVVPPGQGRLVAEQAPQASLVKIPGSGHLPLDEQPELFDAAVKRFLSLQDQK